MRPILLIALGTVLVLTDVCCAEREEGIPGLHLPGVTVGSADEAALGWRTVSDEAAP